MKTCTFEDVQAAREHVYRHLHATPLHAYPEKRKGVRKNFWAWSGVCPRVRCAGLPVSPADWDWTSPANGAGAPKKSVKILPDTFSCLS